MTTTLNPQASGTLRYRVVAMIVATAAVIAITVGVVSILDDPTPVVAGDQAGPTVAQMAETQRLTGLAGYMADQLTPAQAAEAARWNAMAEVYNRARAADAGAARWQAMGASHLAEAGTLTRAQRAETDRLTAMAEAYSD